MNDRDAELIIGASSELEAEHKATDTGSWDNSPFLWIKQMPSRPRGKAGEDLIARWAKARELNVERSPDSQADRVIEGARVEIKLSTLWESGVYKFQQLRNQNYEYLLCLGLSPHQVHAWLIRKSDIPFATIPHQHGGKGGSDTWWLSFKPDAPPTWLPGSGSLSDVYDVLAKLKK